MNYFRQQIRRLEESRLQLLNCSDIIRRELKTIDFVIESLKNESEKEKILAEPKKEIGIFCDQLNADYHIYKESQKDRDELTTICGGTYAIEILDTDHNKLLQEANESNIQQMTENHRERFCIECLLEWKKLASGGNQT